MHAIIETGGKQYAVREGDILTIEKLGADAGSQYMFDRVLAVFDGGAAEFGTPLVTGASVAASVIGDGKAKKLIVYKYKAKKGYHRKKGHRQLFTKVKIESIKRA